MPGTWEGVLSLTACSSFDVTTITGLQLVAMVSEPATEYVIGNMSNHVYVRRHHLWREHSCLACCAMLLPMLPVHCCSSKLLSSQSLLVASAEGCLLQTCSTIPGVVTLPQERIVQQKYRQDLQKSAVANLAISHR